MRGVRLGVSGLYASPEEDTLQCFGLVDFLPSTTKNTIMTIISTIILIMLLLYMTISSSVTTINIKFRAPGSACLRAEDVSAEVL